MKEETKTHKSPLKSWGRELEDGKKEKQLFAQGDMYSETVKMENNKNTGIYTCFHTRRTRLYFLFLSLTIFIQYSHSV